MEENLNQINYVSPIIAMKRYVEIQVIKVVGIEKINEFLKAVQYNNGDYLKKEYKIPFDKGNGVEIITINNTLDHNGEVVCLSTLGIILCADINVLTKDCYRRS